MKEKDGFRAAGLVELHDPGVVICPPGGGGGWTEFPGEGETVHLCGKGLDVALQAMGVTPSGVTCYDPKTGLPYSYQENLMDLEVPILRKRRLVVGWAHHRITQLEASVADPHLLQIRFTATYTDREGQEGVYTHVLSYGGSYTVWWEGEK